MKRSVIALIAIVIAAISAEVASACERGTRADRREWRQHARIQQGWRSGHLTRVERRRLVTGQRRIHRGEWRAMADGRFTARERHRLERAQDRQSRIIYRLKHNQRVRGV